MAKNTEFMVVPHEVQRLILLEAIGCDAKGRVNLKDILKLGLVSKHFLKQLDQLFKLPQLQVNVDIDSEETLDSFLKFKNIHPEWKFYTKLCFKDSVINVPNAASGKFSFPIRDSEGKIINEVKSGCTTINIKDLTSIIDKYADFNEIDLANVDSITKSSLEKIAEKCKNLEKLVLGKVYNDNKDNGYKNFFANQLLKPLSKNMTKILEQCKELKELDISKCDWIDKDVKNYIEKGKYSNLDLAECKIGSLEQRSSNIFGLPIISEDPRELS